MPEVYRLEANALHDLFEGLKARGYSLVGPTQRDGAVIYDALDAPAELPIGWTDEQEGGHYRLKERDDDAYFGYVIGPQSWKKYLHPPVLSLWKAKRTVDSFEVEETAETPPKYAFIGVRACELNAIKVQDHVFLGGEYKDPHYEARREDAFIVAVNCTQAAKTCFCVSMNTGPKADEGFDLALTEVLSEGEHYFTLEVGSVRGAELMQALPYQQATPAEVMEADGHIDNAAQQMGRTLDTTDIKDVLYANLEHERWDEVAQRCLTCGNCTMVCPTCFCTAVEDITDLTGQEAERTRRWDSCFTTEFSYIHGGSVRTSAKSRYRQWMTHKLASWIDQFGSSGCVGCGRCITWCPVGIDITEEMAAIRATGSGVLELNPTALGDENEGGKANGRA